MRLCIILTLSMSFCFYQMNLAMHEQLQQKGDYTYRAFLHRPIPKKTTFLDTIECSIFKERIASWSNYLTQNQIPQAFSSYKELQEYANNNHYEKIAFGLLHTTCQKALELGEKALLEKRFNDALGVLLTIEKTFSKSHYFMARFFMGHVYVNLLAEPHGHQASIIYLQEAIRCYNEAITGGIVEAKLRAVVLYLTALKTTEHANNLEIPNPDIFICEQYLNDVMNAKQIPIQLKIEASYHLGILYTILLNYPAAQKFFSFAALFSLSIKIFHLPSMHNCALLTAQAGYYNQAIELLSVTALKDFEPSKHAKKFIKRSMENTLGYLHNGLIQICFTIDLPANVNNPIRFKQAKFHK